MKVGYGSFGHHYEQFYAHRVSYEVHRGPIPAGLLVCHRYDNRACVNPGHLFVGTNADNQADKNAKGRAVVGKTTFGTAHPLAKLDDDKVRYIRTCERPNDELAEQFGVAHSLIHRVKKRQSWPHVA